MDTPNKKTASESDSARVRFREIASTHARSTLVQLPLWPDDRRGAPNAILRSAVFSAATPIARRGRTRVVDRALPVLPPIAVFYTGPLLYQPELDVCLELWHRCRLTALGHEATFHARSFLKSIGRNTGKSDYAWLSEAFEALVEPSVKVLRRDPVSGGTFLYKGHLVDKVQYDPRAEAWHVRANPDIAALFAPESHTWLQSSARLALGRGYLAKWLHGYFSSHRAPLPISVERLRELSGATTKQLRDFRGKLRRALAEVERVELSEGRRFAWTIRAEDDVVEVTRG